ncbi:MAG: undecaprenyl-diphosphate phosphatase, partial [Oscillospiraceae bacterium]|nr:undecaprenyl-diphosphate phosphatase [Oscillospiraceae bacterium]
MANRRMMFLIVLGTLPLVLVLPIKDKVESLYSNTVFIGIALILTGLILYFSDRMGRGSKTERNATLVDVLIVGLAQAVATVPGLS